MIVKKVGMVGRGEKVPMRSRFYVCFSGVEISTHKPRSECNLF